LDNLKADLAKIDSELREREAPVFVRLQAVSVKNDFPELTGNIKRALVEGGLRVVNDDSVASNAEVKPPNFVITVRPEERGGELWVTAHAALWEPVTLKRDGSSMELITWRRSSGLPVGSKKPNEMIPQLYERLVSDFVKQYQWTQKNKAPISGARDGDQRKL